MEKSILKEVYVIEFTVEKEDGSVRHESFTGRNMLDISRTVLGFKVKEKEHIIGFHCHMTYVMDI